MQELQTTRQCRHKTTKSSSENQKTPSLLQATYLHCDHRKAVHHSWSLHFSWQNLKWRQEYNGSYRGGRTAVHAFDLWAFIRFWGLHFNRGHNHVRCSELPPSHALPIHPPLLFSKVLHSRTNREDFHPPDLSELRQCDCAQAGTATLHAETPHPPKTANTEPWEDGIWDHCWYREEAQHRGLQSGEESIHWP